MTGPILFGIKGNMEKAEQKPKVRVVKAGQLRLKSGVIRVEGEKGTHYKGPCDRCKVMVTIRTPPVVDRELLCNDCIYVARVGKPSTKVKRKGDKVLHYITECDVCGDRGKTPFLPKKSRPYLCDLCYAESDEGKANAERKAERKQERLQVKEQTTTAKAETAEVAEQTADAPEKPVERAEPAPTYKLTCRRCRKKLTLKFRPPKGEAFICPSCYEKESEQEEKRKERPSSSLMFNIECAVCGKHETVNFVPKSLTETICTECYGKKRRK